MAVSNADILGWLNANPGADDTLIANTMREAGVSPEQMAQATGLDYGDVSSRYNTALGIASLPTAAAPVTQEVDYFTQQFEPDRFEPVYTPPPVANEPAGIASLPVAPVETPAPTQVTNADILGWLNANPGADAALINQTMAEAGVSAAQYQSATGSPPPSVTPATVTDLYQEVLGRAPESKKVIEEWEKIFGDTIEPTEVEQFQQSAQLELTNPVVANLKGQILGQNLTAKWTGEGFGSAEANATDMAKILADIGITDISQFGKVTKTVDAAVQPVYAQGDLVTDSEGQQYYSQKIVGYVDQDGKPVDPNLVKTEYISGGESGNDQTVYVAPVGKQEVFGNKLTGQEVASTYGERQTGNAFGGTFTGEGNTGYRVQFDAKGNPLFYTTGASSSDIANWGPILALASVIPSPIQPFAIAANAAVSIDQGDVLGGIAALAGLAGFSDVAAGARIAKAVDSGEPFAIVSSIMNSPFAGNVGGTMLTDTISLRDAGNALNVANNVANENWAGALTSANQLVNSPDLATAAAAARFIKAFETNNFAGMYTAANGFTNAMNAANKVTDKDVALNIANTVAADNSAATAGTQFASLATDTVSDAGNGFTIEGDGGSTLNFPDFTGFDSINADAALFDSSVGDLDASGNITDTTGLDMGDVITTDGTITDTTGLDIGDVIPDGGDDVEELVVTGTSDKADTTTDTTVDTDTVVNDKGEVVIKGTKESCPVGTVLNPVTGDCDPYWDEGTGDDVVVDDKGEVVITAKPESCPVGTVLNPETGECDAVEDKGEVVITDKKDSCPVGTKLNLETGECDPIEETIICPPGKVLNEAGTACIDETVIIGKPESCPVGTTLNLETGECDPIDEPLTCPPGKVLNEAGTACIDETVIIGKPESCPVGTVLNRETGECDPIDETLTCPPGKVLNEAGTACIDEVVITDTKESCPVGTTLNLETGECDPINEDDEECKAGYEKVNGACVAVCKEGYIRNLETGVCEKVEKACPAGQVKNADGKCVPITKPPVNCQPGYERINGVCVPICQPGYVRINGVCKKITPNTVMPSGVIGDQGEKTDPIYAGGMDSFNLLATLQELLAEEPPKKDDKKSKDKTKMATGGHLDDLLAEQMTVDDLLKLLR